MGDWRYTKHILNHQASDMNEPTLFWCWCATVYLSFWGFHARRWSIVGEWLFSVV